MTAYVKSKGLLTAESQDEAYKPRVKPEIAKVRSELLSVCEHMQLALSEIDRIDKLIFPLLHLPEPFVREPKLKDPNDDLYPYQLAVQTVLDESLARVHQKVSSFSRHTKVLEKRVENIVLDLKKKTYVK